MRERKRRMIFIYIYRRKMFRLFFSLFQGGTLEAEARQHGKQFEGSIFPFRRHCRHDPVPHRLRRVPRYCHVEGISLLLIRIYLIAEIEKLFANHSDIVIFRYLIRNLIGIKIFMISQMLEYFLIQIKVSFFEMRKYIGSSSKEFLDLEKF